MVAATSATISGSVFGGDYGRGLVALSIFVAVCASYSALTLASRVASAQGRKRTIWLFCGAVALGSGIWAMHYIGMSAFNFPVTVSYDVPTVLVSGLAAIAASAVALYVVSRKHLPQSRLVAGSLVMGGGICAMHYVGMSALRMPAHCSYDSRLVAASVLIAVAVSYVALWLSFRVRDEGRVPLWVRWLSALFVGVAISAIHYTGMAAARFRISGSVPDLTNAVKVSTLGVIVIALITIAALGVSVLAAAVGRRFGLKDGQLALQRERWSMILDASRDGIFERNLQTGEVTFSNRWMETLGYQPSDFPALPVSCLEEIHPDDEAPSKQALLDHLEKRSEIYDMQVRLRHRDGSWRWIMMRGQAQWNAEGVASRLVGSGSDITAIKESEQRYRELFEKNPLPSLIYDLQTLAILDVNEATVRHYGWSRPELLALTMRSIRIPEEIDLIESKLNSSVGLHQPIGPWRHRRKDGSVIWVKIAGHSIAAWNGKGRLIQIQDITGSIEAEELLKDGYDRMEALVETRTIELRASERRWRALLDAIPQFVWTARAGGALDFFSNQLLEFCGIPVDRLTGSGWVGLVHPADRARAGAVWLESVARGSNLEMEFRLKSKTGEFRWFISRGIPARDEEGRITGWFGTCTDIESQKRGEELLERAVAERTAELAEARDRAESAGKAKAAFLAAMSHEIRTPMNGVVGMTGLVLETELTSEQRAYIDTIRASGEALLSVINDILDYSKIEAGKLELDHCEFDLHTVIEETIELVQVPALAKELPLSFEVDKQVPLDLVGDPGRLRQVLLNLLSNAVKFTERGSVNLRVSLEAMQAEVMVLRFAVRDTGIGLTEKQQEHLFQPFAQADKSTTRRFGGTGLGLSIAKRLVEMMGGTLGVASEAGMGSTFWFNVCLTVNPHVHHSALNGKRVAIAAPVSTCGFAMKQYLEQMGLRIDKWVEDTSELEQWVRRGSAPDVLLIDSSLFQSPEDRLPITSSRAFKRTAMIIMGSPSDCGDFTEETLSPGLKYAAKPVRRTGLLNAIRDAISHGDVNCPVETQTRHLTGRVVRVLVAEDNAINQTVIRRMLEKLGCEIDIVPNGELACQAIKTSNYDLVFMDCHMPVMDGFEATRRIRAQDVEGKRLPVIALTAAVLNEEREQCYACGMDDFLAKPVKTIDLERAMDQWLTARSPAA